MDRPLLILFSYRFPVTQSFISKLAPHLKKKEGRGGRDHLLLVCVWWWGG